MDHIKQMLFNRFRTFSALSLSILLSIVLLMIRMKLTHSFFYMFLVWNLFLAVIPFSITFHLLSSPKLSKFSFIWWFGIWLLFLPNAPYIITDLLHLKVSMTHLLWLDILVIMSFAISGLMLFYLSILDMKSILNNYVTSKVSNFIFFIIFFLTAFGVYLGRFLRYNSWELFQKPLDLISDIFNIIIQPDFEAWLFTLLFGSFLSIGFWMICGLKTR
jgi:uncharacterized membrane protein